MPNTYTTKIETSSAWNFVLNKSGFPQSVQTAAPTLDPTAVVDSAPETVDYYIRFTLRSGQTVSFDTSKLYGIGSFTTGITVDASVGSQAGGFTSGRPNFDPLTITFNNAALLPDLLKQLASSGVFSQIDILGYQNGNATQSTLVVDYSYGVVQATDLQASGSSDGDGSTFDVSFQYGSEKITTYGSAVNGTAAPNKSGSWNVLRNSTTFENSGQNASSPPQNPEKFSSQVGANARDYSATFKTTSGQTLSLVLDNYSFEDTQTANIGSQSSGSGASLVDFKDVTLTFAGSSATAQFLQQMTAGGHFTSVTITGTSSAGVSTALKALQYTFSQAFVTSVSVDASDEVSLTLSVGAEQIAVQRQAPDGSPTGSPVVGGWNRAKNISDDPGGITIDAVQQKSNTAATTSDTGSTASFANLLAANSMLATADGDSHTYYVRFVIHGQSANGFDGSEYYQVTNFATKGTNKVQIGQAGTNGGKPTFAPLSLTLSQGEIAPQLLQTLVSNSTISEIDLIDYDQTGQLARTFSFGVVQTTDLNIDSSGDVGLTFAYRSEALLEAGSGASKPAMQAYNSATGTATFTNGSGSQPFNAPATEPTEGLNDAVDHDGLRYYVHFKSTNTGLSSTSLYEIASFSADISNSATAGSAAGSGSGTRPTFHPVSLSFDPSYDPTFFKLMTSGMLLPEVDIVAYRSDGTLASELSFGEVFTTSVSASTQDLTAIEFTYGSEALSTYDDADGKVVANSSQTWNSVLNKSGFSINGDGTVTPYAAPKIKPSDTLGSDGISGSRTFYIRMTSTGTSGISTSTLYQIQNYDFSANSNALLVPQPQAGKATPADVTVDFSQRSLTTAFFNALTSGRNIQDIDLLGYDARGEIVSDDSFGGVQVSGLAFSAEGAKVTFAYGAVRTQRADDPEKGLSEPFIWNTRTPSGGVSSSAVPQVLAQATVKSSDTDVGDIKYFVRFKSTSGTAPLDGSGLIALDSFNVSATHDTGTTTAGQGTTQTKTQPLSISFAQIAADPTLFQTLATGQHYQEVDILAYGNSPDQLGPKRLVAEYSFGTVLSTSFDTAASGVVNMSLIYSAESIQTFKTTVGQPPHVPPTGADQTVAVAAGSTLVLSPNSFGFADSDGDTLQNVVVVSAPTNGGVLTDNGAIITDGQSISQGDLSNGLVVFTPAPGSDGTADTSLTFALQDSGGAGVDTSETYTFALTVAGSYTAAQAAAASSDLASNPGHRVDIVDTQAQLDANKDAIKSLILAGEVGSLTHTGVAGQPYASFEDDYGGAAAATGQIYYNADGSVYVHNAYSSDGSGGKLLTFTNGSFFTGLPYASYADDFSAAGQLVSATEYNADGSTYFAYTITPDASGGGSTYDYTGGSALDGRNYASYTEHYDASGALTARTLQNVSGGSYSNVEQDVSNGVIVKETFSGFPQGSNYASFSYAFDSAGNLQSQSNTYKDGTHQSQGFRDGVTLTALGNDTLTGAGQSDTFLFNPGFGRAVVTDFYQHLDGTTHDTISVASSEFADFATLLTHTSNVGGSAVITGQNGDALTLLGVTKDQVAANASDFTFHA